MATCTNVSAVGGGVINIYIGDEINCVDNGNGTFSDGNVISMHPTINNVIRKDYIEVKFEYIDTPVFISTELYTFTVMRRGPESIKSVSEDLSLRLISATEKLKDLLLYDDMTTILKYTTSPSGTEELRVSFKDVVISHGDISIRVLVLPSEGEPIPCELKLSSVMWMRFEGCEDYVYSDGTRDIMAESYMILKEGKLHHGRGQ